jgi:alcohol dehydrogenase class IV
VKSYRSPGYTVGHPLVPHGVSVILNAPAVFRFTGPSCPDRHLKAAEAMGADVTDAPLDTAGDILADRIVAMMKETGIPNGLSGVGYSEDDLPQLIEKANAQQRLLVNSPKPVGRAELGPLFRDAMRYW